MNLLFAAISKRTASKPARPLHAMAQRDKGRRSTSQTRRVMSSSSRGHQSVSRRDRLVAPVPDSRVYSKAPEAFGHAETPLAGRRDPPSSGQGERNFIMGNKGEGRCRGGYSRSTR